MRHLTPFLTSIVFAGAVAAQEAPRDVMVVFDMSGSMWGQVDGVAKVDIARDAFGSLITDWDANNTSAGLIAYGHRRRGDCSDIELLAQPSDGADIAALIAPLQPRGKTPLSDAVQQAAEVLRFTEEKATVVLLSDGVETCEADPCAVGAELEALGLDFTAHVIGFDIAEGDKAQLQCLASATGGQYFDASDAGELGEAMQGVVKATSTEPQVREPAQDYQEVTIRVRTQTRTIRLPDTVTVFGDGIELGTVTRDAAVIPGLAANLEFGSVTLRVEGAGISGEQVFEVTDQTEIIDLEVTSAEADYVIWREGQFPIVAANRTNIVLLKNTTGVDRSSFYGLYMYPSGSTDKAQRVKVDNLAPTAGIFVDAEIPSPATPGDYDLVPTGTDGTEYARIPISFASGIDPVWQGAREVEPGGVLDAYWAGSSSRFDQFRFMRGEDTVSRVQVGAIAQEDGFKLPVPSEAGLYELVYVHDYVNNAEFKTTSMGQIAVGVPLPQDEAPDFDTTDMRAETEAMGGEDGPLLPVGVLHGDWVLMARNDAFNVPLARFQMIHEEGAATADGDLVLEAFDEWGLGPQGSTGTTALTIVDESTRTLTLATDTGLQTVTLRREGDVWRAPPDMVTQMDGIALDVIVVRPEDIAAIDKNPIGTSYFSAYDERGNQLTGPVDWIISAPVAGVFEETRTATHLNQSTTRPQGTYMVTATAGALTGTEMIPVSRSWRANSGVVLRNKGEGENLPIDTAYFCSVGEDCNMFEHDYDITFTLPVGWGAERPFRLRNWKTAFDMVTLTDKGPFFVTLNDPAAPGTCIEGVTGTLCHAATDDPELLADIDTIRRGLSFQSTGPKLDEDAMNTLLNKLIGDTQ